MVRRMAPLLAALLLAAAPLAAQVMPGPQRVPGAPHLPPLPDPTGWGVPVLSIARAPDGGVWVGTYGEGIYVLRPGALTWENIRADTTPGALSWDLVHAFAFVGRDVWYGTVGNGWGLSRDGGHTWQNWEFRQLGPRWQYVVPDGIVTRGDSVFIGTADGIRWTADHGATWHDITDAGPGALPSRYVLALAPARDGGLLVATLHGFGTWRYGVGYRPMDPAATPLGARLRAIFPIQATLAVAPAILGGERCVGTLRPKRREVDARWECMTFFSRAGLQDVAVRDFAACEGVLCGIATSTGAMYTGRMGLLLQPQTVPARARDVYAVLGPPPNQGTDTVFGTACGLLGQQPTACLELGDSAGAARPEPLRHTWFARPVATTEQPYIDQTYRYGSTMGGAFQQHQGVEFNEPALTPVLAVEAGTVVYAGRAEQGALTVAIRHDSTLTTAEGVFHLFSVYYHNSALLVRVGQRVHRGQPIARVGSTGRATNEHLHLEIHASPVDSVALVVDSLQRYPPYTRNPELWIEPLPGTGVVAGQVWGADGRPVQQARIYGLVKPEPQETPFAFAETYGARTRGDPAYDEHFAVGDVPPGEYVLGTTIDGRKVFRRIVVEAGKLTWVEFR